MIRPLCLHPLALTQWERIALHVDGVLGFRPGSGDQRADMDLNGDFYKKKGRDPNYGKVKGVAIRFIAGEFGEASYYDVATAEDVSGESLKNTIWRIKRQWKEKPRKAQRRRVAA